MTISPLRSTKSLTNIADIPGNSKTEKAQNRSFSPPSYASEASPLDQSVPHVKDDDSSPPVGPVIGIIEKPVSTKPIVRGRLKEVIAIVRPTKHIATRQALEAVGIFSYTTYTVLGRSRQRGLRFQSEGKEGISIKFLPKQYFSIVVSETQLSATVAVIIKANRTGGGEIGDGRIFVLDLDDAVRVSTDERGAEAVR